MFRFLSKRIWLLIAISLLIGGLAGSSIVDLFLRDMHWFTIPAITIFAVWLTCWIARVIWLMSKERKHAGS
jgi:hypothetical protein